MEYSSILKGQEYDFIKTNEHLGKHVILLGLAGSYSYGTNNENSDIDVRGVTLNRKSDLIGMTQFEQYVDDKATMYHYYGTAQKNYQEYLTEEMVKYKKYFYVLRPLLACKWIEKKTCPPPVLFKELVEEVLEPDMKPVIEELVQLKMQMTEAEKGRRIDKINHYIEENLSYYKRTIEAMKDDRNADWKELNQLFYRQLLQ